MTVLGPRSGTLAGTPKDDVNVCLLSTPCSTLIAVKYFGWDDAKNAKLKGLTSGSAKPNPRDTRLIELVETGRKGDWFKRFEDAHEAATWLNAAAFLAGNGWR